MEEAPKMSVIVPIYEVEKLKRRNIFSIRINSSRMSIILFGIQIVEVGA